ncbi:MAG TPA: triose-phosphate isomerase [Desulfobacteraceae bacterium]|jgi:triosephosphate isomerase|nr:triose-phosphate isomerase [Desulfobacteraceae bacterium]HPJ66326.1 triose-phosphate isomerase [Desulfobacteraceae bacterium]HPQ28413.1 triose-phosphate isomerase [Desulfobacteraceae bacterium]
MIKRRHLIAGNWKMNLDVKESVKLVESIAPHIADLDEVDVLIAPPFTSLGAVNNAIGNSGIKLGAQNMHWEMNGAYTGEISGPMLKEAGCTHVILGHSERRILFKETDDLIDLKVKAAVVQGLIPILCIGETLEERENGKTFDVIKNQLDNSLLYLRKNNAGMPVSTILAYEPVWAIGTGRTASGEQAQEVHHFIRKWIKEEFNDETAARVRILYGGSVNPDNVADLMSQPDIDGGLVGGASLKADLFIKIMHFQNKLL